MAHIYKKRRRILYEKLTEISSQGVLLLFGNFEDARYLFRQESSYYYLTGVTEPGSVFLGFIHQLHERVYIPHTGSERSKWVTSSLVPSEHDGGQCAHKLKVDTIGYLGSQIAGYSISSVFKEDTYKHLLEDMKEIVRQGIPLFTLFTDSSLYQTQRNLLLNFCAHVEGLDKILVDATPIVHEMRRKKSDEEIACIQRAIDITLQAQREVAHALHDGMFEYEARAVLEHVFLRNGIVRPAFPSIVATGKNTTVLHYTDLNQRLRHGDCVVVDIGAEYDYYAADITRTYPVSGAFTKRQKEIYSLVLDAQEYAYQNIKQGMYLYNNDEQELSLHHIVVNFLKKHGCDQFFVHGIGHFLGLDVHDVGNVKIPLKEGDVFTIEPGLYIPSEGIGVRIEDDYIMTQEGCRSLSEALSKGAKEVEALVSQGSKKGEGG